MALPFMSPSRSEATFRVSSVVVPKSYSCENFIPGSRICSSLIFCPFFKSERMGKSFPSDDDDNRLKTLLVSWCEGCDKDEFFEIFVMVGGGEEEEVNVDILGMVDDFVMSSGFDNNDTDVDVIDFDKSVCE